jgi:BON domain
MGRDDADIAKAIAHILEWNVQIPEGKVHARVENGWVVLAGEVRYDFQRREVERMVRQVRGVTGVTNAITVNPPASPGRRPDGHRGRTAARGRGGRAPHPGRGFRPHREALRARALEAGGERSRGRSRGGAGRRPRGEPPRGYPLMPS